MIGLIKHLHAETLQSETFSKKPLALRCLCRKDQGSSYAISGCYTWIIVLLVSVHINIVFINVLNSVLVNNKADYKYTYLDIIIDSNDDIEFVDTVYL